MRRVGGARINDSRRIKLLSLSEPSAAPEAAADAPAEATGAAGPPLAEYDGWILNLSRGGVRLILEETVSVGQALMVHIGDDGEPDAVRRPARVVWVMQEPDGVIAGLEFSDGRSSGSSPSLAAMRVAGAAAVSEPPPAAADEPPDAAPGKAPG